MTKPNPKTHKDEKKDYTLYELDAATHPDSDVDLSNEDSPGRKMLNQQLQSKKK